MNLAVGVIIVVLVAVGWWQIDLRRRPYARCLWCRGRSGRNTKSRQRWGNCRHCGGSGKRLRWLAKDK